MMIQKLRGTFTCESVTRIRLTGNVPTGTLRSHTFILLEYSFKITRYIMGHTDAYAKWRGRAVMGEHHYQRFSAIVLA